LGAALTIAGVSTNKGAISWLLTRGSIRFVGRISYSLYLWHWPVIVSWRLLYPDQSGIVRVVSILSLTSALAAASSRYIERPIYKGSAIKSTKWLLILTFSTTALLLILPIAINRTEGLPGRISASLLAKRDEALARPMSGFANCLSEEFCIINEDIGVPPSFLFWGDSHAEALLPAVARAAQRTGVSGIYIQRSGCVALLGVWQDLHGYAEECKKNGEDAIEALRQHPSIGTVLIASRWALYQAGDRYLNDPGDRVTITDATGSTDQSSVFFNGLTRTVDAIHKLRADIYFVKQVPEVSYPVTDTWVRRQIIGAASLAEGERADFDKRNDAVGSILRSLQLDYFHTIDLTKWFCDKLHCRTVSNGMPIYRDNNHITSSFSGSMSDSFMPALGRGGGVANK
jgi:hypothetical protein